MPPTAPSWTNWLQYFGNDIAAWVWVVSQKDWRHQAADWIQAAHSSFEWKCDFRVLPDNAEAQLISVGKTDVVKRAAAHPNLWSSVCYISIKICAYFIVCSWGMPIIGPTNSVSLIYINSYFMNIFRTGSPNTDIACHVNFGFLLNIRYLFALLNFGRSLLHQKIVYVHCLLVTRTSSCMAYSCNSESNIQTACQLCNAVYSIFDN